MQPGQAAVSNQSTSTSQGASTTSSSGGGTRSNVQLKDSLRGQGFAAQEQQLTPGVQRRATGGSAGGVIQMKGAAVQRDGGGTPPAVYNDQANVGHATVSGQGGASGASSTTGGYSTQGGGTANIAREYQIWPAPGAPPIPPMPIAAVPGMFITWTPSVKASVGAQVSGIMQGESERQYSVGVSGSVQAGIEYGVPPAASIYLRFGPTVQAQMQGTFDSQGLKSVEGTIALDAAITVGAQAGSGAVDYNVVLSRANIGRFVGFRYTRGQGTTYGTFEPGRPLLDAIEWGRAAARRANQIYETGAAAVRRAGTALSSAWTWLTS